jgi:N-acetylglucosamine-6-sulfatase
MNRRQMLASLAGAASLAAALQTKRRNIIFILSDDHRYDAFGFLKAQPWLETPQLDRLALEGAHFKNAFVTTALCSPSRASILTGKYARNHRTTKTLRVPRIPAERRFSRIRIRPVLGCATGPGYS